MQLSLLVKAWDIRAMNHWELGKQTKNKIFEKFAKTSYSQ